MQNNLVTQNLHCMIYLLDVVPVPCRDNNLSCLYCGCLFELHNLYSTYFLLYSKHTVLNKLESDGYVTQSQRIISKDNRVRVYYKITDDGRHYLTELTNTYFALSDAVNSILFGGENDESHN